MVTAIMGYSSVPLVIAIVGGSDSPFLFNAGLRLGLVLGGVAFLFIAYKHYLQNTSILKILGRRAFSWTILLIIIGNNFDHALFAWSVRFIDISVAAVLVEIWPILVILLMDRFVKGYGHKKIDLTTLLLVAVCFLGVAFVIGSQTGGFLWTGERLENMGLSSVVGVVLALAAALAIAFAAFGFKWANEVTHELSLEHQARSSDLPIDWFCVVAALVICSTISAPINAAAGWITGESISFDSFVLSVIAGGLVQALASICWRKANITTDNLGINAIAYGTPVFSLVWLFLFWEIGTPRVDFLVIGVTAIIAANLLINFEAEIRLGFRALLLALAGCGTIVYLREAIFESFDTIQWKWSGNGYFESIAVAATVFTLLIAFRVARLVSRSNDETMRFFSVYRKLELLVKQGVVHRDVLRWLRIMDESREQRALEDAYERVRSCILNGSPRNNLDYEISSQAAAELDTLVHSKQGGLVLGEMFAIVIFAGITVVLSLLTYPSGQTGIARVLVDLFAMLMSAVVIFLVFYVFDLDRERSDSKLEYSAVHGEYILRFPDAGRRLFDQTLSIFVGVAIVLTYGGLLGHKWLGV